MVIRVPGGAINNISDAKARVYPDHMYVDVPTLVKNGGGIVFLIVALSLILSRVTGFSIINPAMAVLIAIGSAAFFFMGNMMQARGGKHVATPTANR
jgi:hypothetical protein